VANSKETEDPHGGTSVGSAGHRVSHRVALPAVAIVLGVDLSGPTNTADTAAAWFRATSSELVFQSAADAVSDAALLELVARLSNSNGLIVGLDAPLSYNPGGGDRPGDAQLRRLLVARGLPPGTVMPPTMTRMAYLTLRGIAVARAIERSTESTHIVDVHPGAAMALRGAPVDELRAFKRSAEARRTLARWLRGQAVRGLPAAPATDHELAAYACALAAWHWNFNSSAWSVGASDPLHPYDFAC